MLLHLQPRQITLPSAMAMMRRWLSESVTHPWRPSALASPKPSCRHCPRAELRVTKRPPKSEPTLSTFLAPCTDQTTLSLRLMQLELILTTRLVHLTHSVPTRSHPSLRAKMSGSSKDSSLPAAPALRNHLSQPQRIVSPPRPLVSFKTSPISSILSQILSKSSNPNFIRSSMNPSFATLTVSSSATTTMLLIPPMV